MEPPVDPIQPNPSRMLDGRLIVVIDDDESLRSLMGSFLRRAGATVQTAANGRDALCLMQSLLASGSAVHAVLCDLRMSGGSGMELHRSIAESLPTLASRVIFSSGDVESDDVRTFIEESGVAVLAKPYSLTELRRLLAALPIT